MANKYHDHDYLDRDGDTSMESQSEDSQPFADSQSDGEGDQAFDASPDMNDGEHGMEHVTLSVVSPSSSWEEQKAADQRQNNMLQTPSPEKSQPASLAPSHDRMPSAEPSFSAQNLGNGNTRSRQGKSQKARQRRVGEKDKEYKTRMKVMEQNRLAATRYRAKKKAIEQMLQDYRTGVEKQNEELKIAQIPELERKVKWYQDEIEKHMKAGCNLTTPKAFPMITKRVGTSPQHSEGPGTQILRPGDVAYVGIPEARKYRLTRQATTSSADSATITRRRSQGGSNDMMSAYGTDGAIPQPDKPYATLSRLIIPASDFAGSDRMYHQFNANNTPAELAVDIKGKGPTRPSLVYPSPSEIDAEQGLQWAGL